MEIKDSAPYISFNDTTANEYSARMSVNSKNIYLQSSTDDVNFSTVFQFELDTKRGYINGSEISTAATILNIGTSAGSARSAMGLGGLSLLDIGDLVYTGSSQTNTSYPIGTTFLVLTNNGSPTLNQSVIPVIVVNGSSRYVGTTLSGHSGTTIPGTWRGRRLGKTVRHSVFRRRQLRRQWLTKSINSFHNRNRSSI